LSKRLTVALVFLLALLTACSSGNSGVNSPSPDTGQPSATDQPAKPAEGAGNEVVEIRTAWFGSVARHELFNKLLDMFEAEHPNIKVVREYSDWNGYWDKLNTQAAGGNAPDVIQFTPLHIAEYAGRDVPLNLEEYVKSGKIDLSDWDPKVVESGKYRGNLYMVSIGMSSPAMFANVDLLNRAGIAMPETDLSYSEFASFVKEGQSKLGDGAWMLFDSGGNFDHFVIYLLQKGKKITSDDGTKLGFDQKDVEEWLSWWDDMREAGAVPPAEVMAEHGSKPWEDSLLVHQKVAIHATNGNQLKIFQRYMEDRVDILRLPTMPGGASKYGEVFTGVFLAISKNSKHPEEAAKLINFWANHIEANKLYNFEHGIIGSNKVNDALKEQLTEEDKKVIAHANAVLETAPATTERPKGYSAISSAFTKTNEQVQFKQGTVEQAAAAFIGEAQKLLTR